MTYGLTLVYRRHGKKERWCGRRSCVSCCVRAGPPSDLCQPELLVTNEGFVFVTANIRVNTIRIQVTGHECVWRASICGTAVHDRSIRVCAVRLVYLTVLRYCITLYKAESFQLCSSLTRPLDSSSFCSQNSQDWVH